MILALIYFAPILTVIAYSLAYAKPALQYQSTIGYFEMHLFTSFPIVFGFASWIVLVTFFFAEPVMGIKQ